MADYKDTVNLPKTTFPMKANLAESEPKILQFWTENKIETELREQGKKRPKFIMHDGPPYANGDIHLGHAVNKVLKDIVIKAKSLSGYDAPFVPGWDCHGLPIELNVEKKLGTVGQKVSANDFRAACRTYAREQLEKQRQDFTRLGVWGTWDAPYTTMDHAFEADTMRALAHLVREGHVYKGYKPVHWCLDCASALAEAEVEYQDKQSPSIDIFFKSTDTNEIKKRFKLSNETFQFPIGMAVWTTTPWTLPANQAVAVHPELQYVLVKMQFSGENIGLVIAESLLPSVLARLHVETHQILGTSLGADLEHLKLQHPFYDRIVPVVLAPYVTLEVGTGAVHTAPAHGQEDYETATAYRLPLDNPVGENGCFIPSTPLFAGQHVFKANSAVITVLRDKGALLSESSITHSYPHCWRHKTPVIFRATDQWFISMDKKGLREKALAAIANVQWIPTWSRERLRCMIEKRPDWCISRQRTWGVPLPFFVHKETGALHPNTPDLIEQVAKQIEHGGIEAWYALDPSALLGKDNVHYTKSNHILDVWFESGITHHAILKRRSELGFPADLYLEGSDQHRGWFQSSLLTGVAIGGKAPYRAVLTHGFTVDAHGHKMSKSLGNVIAPQVVIQKRGADVLRLWIASSDYCGKEITASEEILDRTSDSYRRIRNTARYIISNLFDFDPATNMVSAKDLLPLDRWAIEYAVSLQKTVREAYDQYQFHEISQKVQHFCTVPMGSCYLDIIKDRLYTMAANSLGRRSAQTALYHIGEALVRWLAPILSFTAEEIWKALPGRRASSVLLSSWYQGFPHFEKQTNFSESFWETLWQVRAAVNKALEALRNGGLIGSNLTAEVLLYADEPLKKLLTLCGNELRFILITSDATVLNYSDAPRECESTELSGLKIKVIPSNHRKCVRCWHQRETVGKNDNHRELCDRCIGNITGKGERRKFA